VAHGRDTAGTPQVIATNLLRALPHGRSAQIAALFDLHPRMSAWSLLHRWRAEELATGATRALADWQLMSAAALARSLLEGAMAFAWEAAKMESIWTEMKATGPPLVGEEISFREPLDAALESAQIGSRLAGAHVERSNVVTLVDKGIRSANLDKATVKEVYGYRPGKSAHQALATCRQRCWTYDWVIDLDVQKFFDEVPWDLVIRAVETVTDARWGLLYVKRWLAAPLEHPAAPMSSKARELRKGRRSRRSWRTCSCTTRSTPGWPGTSRAARLSATPTMPSCTARAGARPSSCSAGSPRG
jgi:Reverse transcriptase (RNA-dependent DNA polymerase)